MVPTIITCEVDAMAGADGGKLAVSSQLEQIIDERIRKVTHEIREIERQLSIVRLIDNNKKCDEMAQKAA